MRTVIETFTTVLLISVTVFICACFIGVQLQTNQAKDLHTECVNKIEASDFEPATITACKNEAMDKGYTLEVDNTWTQKKTCTLCNMTVPSTQTKCPACGSEELANFSRDRIYTVKLKYKIDVPVIGLEREGVINGYAR